MWCGMKKIILIITIVLFLSGCDDKIEVFKDSSKDNIYIKDEFINNNSNASNSNDVLDDKPNNESSNDNVTNSNTNQDNNSNNDTNNSSDVTNNNGNNSSNNTDNKENTNDDEVIVYTFRDIEVINAIENVDQNVDKLLEKSAQDDKGDIKDKVSGIFITLVDFVFYDGEIKGITFDELTENGKAKVLDLINNIDQKIEKHFPKYKESISITASNALKKASELIKNGAKNVKDFAKEKLGDMYYQDIIDAKDEFVKYTSNAIDFIKDFSSTLFSDIKDKFNEWYDNFKNKNVTA